MADAHGCTELRRLDKAEESIMSVRDSLTDIKDSLHKIDKDLRIDLSKMSEQFTKFIITMESIAVKSEERDRRNHEISQENKSSFERYGNRIESLEDELAAHDKLNAQQDLKIGTLEKVLYGGMTSLGGLVIWILDTLLNK
jgi:chromosome segregation ATPase